MDRPPNPAPWSYILIRLLFKLVLKVFYGTIVIENADLIPQNGRACIVCANHSNSLTDALIMVTSVPTEKRNFLRLTAKATQFGKRTLQSWLIESAGTLPIKRKKDSTGGDYDNTESMAKLSQALEEGDAVCLFPEGISRYHPGVAPLKTGVARLLSDVLSKNRENEDFEISILTCSITYMHREHFRSDVLVTFHPPMTFTPKDNPELLTPVDFSNIRALTAKMQAQISMGTIDSPSWDLVRCGKIAAKIYAPLGTGMSLGDYVRVWRSFVEAFKWAETVLSDGGAAQSSGSDDEDRPVHAQTIDVLRRDLRVYQDDLARLGLKDDRVRQPRSRINLIRRLLIRSFWIPILTAISAPGAILWSPIFVATYFGVKFHLTKGPVWDTWDEIAQLKLLYGLVSGLAVWLFAVLVTLPVAAVTAIALPLFMWISLRWFEDLVAACRAWRSLVRLLFLGPKTVGALSERRKDLHERVLALATEHLGLPSDPEKYFLESGGRHKGRVLGTWQRGAKYFSLRRRRKRDWNEILRLHDKVDFPDEF